MIKSLIKKDIFSHLISPHFYICALLLYLSCTLQIFFFNRFFVEGFGTSDLNVFFAMIPYVFSLIIPVLVLQVSNREFENTFPISSYKIIISKLFSTEIMIFIMTLPLILVPIIVNFFGFVDVGQVFVAFIGILFYGFLAISVCLLLNELILSKPAFVAVSIIVLIGIDSIHLISLYIQSSNLISKLVNAFSFMWHYDSFSKGILDSRDVLYFVLSTTLILTIAYFINESKRGKKFFDGKQKKYSIVVLLIFIFAFVDSNKYFCRLDFTQNHQFSVSKYTKNNLKTAKEPIRITYYRSKELINRYPEVRDIYDYLKICASENSNIMFKLSDADKIENQEILSNLNVYPQQLQIVNNNKTEYINVYSAIVLEYLGRQKVIPFVLSTTSLEFELNLRFDELIHNKTHSVYLLCANEYELNDYNYLQLVFENSNITTYAITKESLDYLAEQLEIEIPLIIFGTSRLTPEQSSKIEAFILKGGKVICLTSKYSVAINGDWGITKNHQDNFIPVLENWGIIFEDKLVNDLANVRISFYSAPEQNSDFENIQYEYVNYPQWISVLPQENTLQGFTMFWPSPIKKTNSIEPLFYSSDYSWTVKEYDNTMIERTGKYFLSDPFTVSKYFINDSDFTQEKSILGAKLKGSITGLYNFETQESPQLIVISDQYFAMNLLLELSSGGTSDFRNLDYLLNSILELNDEQELARLQNAGLKNITLYKLTEYESFTKTKNISLFIIFGIIPFLYILLAIIIFILRKQKNEKYR